MYHFLIILIILIIFYENKEGFTIMALNKKYNIRREDCLKYCDEAECLKMFDMKKKLNECKKCNDKGLCYKKNILDGVCEACVDGIDYGNCNLISNYGCTNPDNILDFNGVEPYYLIVDDDNNYSYKNTCKFCWNI